MTDFVVDEAYKAKVMTAVTEAVFFASLDPEQKVAMIRTGEVVDVMLATIAGTVSSSDIVSSPTKLREFCTAFGKRLQRAIAAEQARRTRDGEPFETVHLHGEMH